jgi:DNA-binding transcriptional LysR family regulator
MQWDDRIGRRVKLRDVHILLTAVQCGSMAKAAERLAISHPVVSKTIADLEHAMGVRLLERSRQGVEPTLYGRAVLKHGLAAFDELRQCVKEIEFLSNPTAGEVRIGSIYPFAAGLTSAVIDRLSRRYPQIVFRLVAEDVGTLCRELIDRNIDLLIALRAGPTLDAGLDFELLHNDSYVIAAGAQNPWVRRRKIELAELADEQWVLPPPESFIGSAFGNVFRNSGLDYPRATVISYPHDVRITMLATGRFLSMFLASILRFLDKGREIKALAVDLPIADVQMGIFTLKNRAVSPVAQLFIEQAREIAKPLATRRGKGARRVA